VSAAGAKARKRRPAAPRNPDEPTIWQRRTYDFGRVAVFAIPVFALIAGLFPRSGAAFSSDPLVYANYLAVGRWEPSEVLIVGALGITGVLSIAGLAALVWRGRARVVAVLGGLCGLLGSIALFWTVGSVVIRQDAVRHALLTLDWSKLAYTAHVTGSTAALYVLGGAALLTIGWILLGVGVLRMPGMNRADGPLLMISAPLMFLGGMVAHVLPTMGSFLMVAAGLGIVFTSDRVPLAGEIRYFRRRSKPMPVVVEPALAAGAQDSAVGLTALGLARPEPVVDERTSAGAEADAPADIPATAVPATTVPASAVPVGAAANGDGTAGTTPTVQAGPPATIDGDMPAQTGNGHVGTDDSPSKPPSGASKPSSGTGRPPAERPAPTGKSLRDLLRDARGAAISWQVSRSRASVRRAPTSNSGSKTGGAETHKAGRNAGGWASAGTSFGKAASRAAGNVSRMLRSPSGYGSGRNSRSGTLATGTTHPHGHRSGAPGTSTGRPGGGPVPGPAPGVNGAPNDATNRSGEAESSGVQPGQTNNASSSKNGASPNDSSKNGASANGAASNAGPTSNGASKNGAAKHRTKNSAGKHDRQNGAGKDASEKRRAGGATDGPAPSAPDDSDTTATRPDTQA
jgi:hypothetical protein